MNEVATRSMKEEPTKESDDEGSMSTFTEEDFKARLKWNEDAFCEGKLCFWPSSSPPPSSPKPVAVGEEDSSKSSNSKSDGYEDEGDSQHK